MSLSSALTDLSDAASELSRAIAELVVVVHEDRPESSQIAIVDRLAEVVSELQASGMLAGQLIAGVADPRQLAAQLWYVDQAVGSCNQIYWRDLRSYLPLHELRLSAASRGREWRTWQRSIEVSLLRCEAPLLRAAHAVRGAWREIGELLTHYLPPPGALAVSAQLTPSITTKNA